MTLNSEKKNKNKQINKIKRFHIIIIIIIIIIIFFRVDIFPSNSFPNWFSFMLI